MFLFIFESIGTSELALIAIVALIFLGPRKMPEMAKKIGKMMSDFRSTTSEFKETWQREVNFEDEIKAFKIDDDDPKPVKRVTSILDTPKNDELKPPTIKEIDPASFEHALPPPDKPVEKTGPEDDLADKRNWL